VLLGEIVDEALPVFGEVGERVVVVGAVDVQVIQLDVLVHVDA